MKTIVLATVAATLLAGAASAQGLPDGKGNAAGGYRERRLGVDSRGTTLDREDGAVDPRATGTVRGPATLPGTPPDGKGNAAGGYRGDQQRRLGTDGGAGADDSDGDGDE